MIGIQQSNGDLVKRIKEPMSINTRIDFGCSGDACIVVSPDKLIESCLFVTNELFGNLITMVGLDDRSRSGRFRLVYVFSVKGRFVSVESAIDPDKSVFPSLTPYVPAAHWYEREVRDMLGLIPEGHPDPRRLVLHDDWPEGVFSLRKDFDPQTPVPRIPGSDHRFHQLHGEGIIEIPVGPIHAGVIEPGHFRFAAVGEMVLHLETRLFYSHRGIEKLAEGKFYDHVLQIAERICGACSMSHAVSFCQAMEGIADLEIPPKAKVLRTVMLELERLYNHIGDIGNICAGVGFAIGTSLGSSLKEELQRLNERLTKHRFLRGVCKVGGVRQELDAKNVVDALKTLNRVEIEFRDYIEMLMAKDSFLDRLTGTGVVPGKAALDLGAVGVTARASGIDRDSRRDHPHAAYDRINFDVPVRTQGDVRARVEIRIEEAVTSFSMVRALLSNLPPGALSVSVGEMPAHKSAIGITESPRGENIHWVRTGENGTIDRLRVRSASYCNWPVVALSVPGNMVPDFPLINKSFELCYSCLDR